MAVAGAYPYVPIKALVETAVNAHAQPIFLALDGVTDPHNLGAIVRSAEVLGAAGVILPAKGATPVNAGAVKASAGATERISISRVANLLKTLDHMRDDGFVVLGARAEDAQPAHEANLNTKLVLVVGSEGAGLREAVARRCSGFIAVSQLGAVGSLNVSVAAALLLYEAQRQRGFSLEISGKAPNAPG